MAVPTFPLIKVNPLTPGPGRELQIVVSLAFPTIGTLRAARHYNPAGVLAVSKPRGSCEKKERGDLATIKTGTARAITYRVEKL